MLCPKCGFISFDHLSVCGKCRNDLSEIGAALQGTAADVAGRYFLGSLIKEGAESQGYAEELEVASSEGVTAAAGMAVPSREGTLDIDLEETAQEEGRALYASDDSPALEFDLDEIPHLGSGEHELAAGAESPVAAMAPPIAEEESSLFAGELAAVETAPELPPAVESTADEGPELELDVASLTLDSSAEEESPASGGAAEPPEDESGQLAIDLNSIDLSDLVHHEEGAESPPQGTREAGGLEVEDTMDLSLFTGEANVAPSGEAGPALGADDLNPIDLTLVDEALEELTLDPSRKVEPHAAKGGQDILGLSMEESDK